jgi:putative ABC transport system substrate-binding protein
MDAHNIVVEQKSVKRRFYSFYLSPLPGFICIFLIFFTQFLVADRALAKTVRIGILMAGDTRQAPVDGLKKGLEGHTAEEGHTFIYDMKNAAGDKKRLTEMAVEIVAGKPDVAVAAGGIEADALLVATAGTNIPVVFLSVSSSVDRGVVASMVSSGNNFTGIDTNDANLTAKRLWFIRKILPEAKKVFCFHTPSSVPSVQSLAVARQSASDLGFELQVAEVESVENIKSTMATVSRATTDVILLFPIVPVEVSLRSDIFPKAMAEKIPIFGYSAVNIQSGAFASYAGSRYANGLQAARLIHKIVNGIKPTDIPVETSEKFELILNKDLVAKLGLKLGDRAWRMADEIVDLQFPL